MRILQLAGYFFPEKAASIYLEENRYEAFSNAGFKTIVYAARPQRGLTEEEYQEYKNKKLEMMYNGGVEVHRFAMYREGKNAVLRAFRYFLISVVQLWKGIWAKDIDLIYVASTPPTQGALAALVKKFKKVPFVYNLQDIFPDSLAGTGLAKKGGLLWKIGRTIENFTYRNADKIIVISQDFKKNIMAKGVPEEKIEVVYNWVDENEVTPIAKEDNPLFDELGLSRSDFHVLYAGNLGEAQYLDVVIDAAEQLQSRQEIQFIIFGTGGLEDQLKAEVARRGLPNVRFFPLQPLERVSQVYSLGDVGIVSCKPGIGACAMPSKTWTILSTGRAALVHFDEGELHHIIQRANCGVFTLSGDTEAFVNAITDLADNPEKCRELGANGRQFILRNLTCEYGTSRYVEVIKSLAAKEQ